MPLHERYVAPAGGMVADRASHPGKLLLFCSLPSCTSPLFLAFLFRVSYLSNLPELRSSQLSHWQWIARCSCFSEIKYKHLCFTTRKGEHKTMHIAFAIYLTEHTRSIYMSLPQTLMEISSFGRILERAKGSQIMLASLLQPIFFYRNQIMEEPRTPEVPP